jgi:cell division initiation protein
VKLSPMDIKQREFKTVFRGADRVEVREFLENLAQQVEEMVLEITALKEEHGALLRRTDEYSAREQTLRETLVTAQKVAGDVKDLAGREGRVIVQRAEAEAEGLLVESLKRKELLPAGIQELKGLEAQFETTLRGTVEVHLRLMDSLRGHEQELDTLDHSIARLQAPPPAPDSGQSDIFTHIAQAAHEAAHAGVDSLDGPGSGGGI